MARMWAGKWPVRELGRLCGGAAGDYERQTASATRIKFSPRIPLTAAGG